MSDTTVPETTDTTVPETTETTDPETTETTEAQAPKPVKKSKVPPVEYVIEHTAVSQFVKGEVVTFPDGTDIDRLLTLGAISVRNAPTPDALREALWPSLKLRLN